MGGRGCGQHTPGPQPLVLTLLLAAPPGSSAQQWGKNTRSQELVPCTHTWSFSLVFALREGLGEGWQSAFPEPLKPVGEKCQRAAAPEDCGVWGTRCKDTTAVADLRDASIHSKPLMVHRPPRGLCMGALPPEPHFLAVDQVVRPSPIPAISTVFLRVE